MSNFPANRKIFTFAIIAILLLAGIIALTQELSETTPIEITENQDTQEVTQAAELPPVNPVRWFRSNAGGMAIEELGTRFVALRHEFALAIDIENYGEIPDRLWPYYTSRYSPEIRTLYKNGEIIRTQWIFRDENRNTRVNAVFIEPKEEKQETVEPPAQDNRPSDSEQETESNEQVTENEQAAESEQEAVEPDVSSITVQSEQTSDSEQITENNQTGEPEPEKKAPVQIAGFIEIFDENSFLTSEIRFYEDGRQNKIEYESSNNLIISASFHDWDDDTRNFILSYTDYYRYNRSLSLRSVERVFYKDNEMTDDIPVIVAFPRRIMEIINENIFTVQRQNLHPDFFGDMFVFAESKMVYQTDERGRIISQTLYNEDDDIIWIIRNTWTNDRITTSVKTEGDTVLRVEYVYAGNGDRLVERNFRNGNLERVVRTENKTDIEELYFNNVLVLQAVWVDGRKISETRVR